MSLNKMYNLKYLYDDEGKHITLFVSLDCLWTEVNLYSIMMQVKLINFNLGNLEAIPEQQLVG